MLNLQAVSAENTGGNFSEQVITVEKSSIEERGEAYNVGERKYC